MNPLGGLDWHTSQRSRYSEEDRVGQHT